MSYGIRTINANGIVNIDENSYSYVYIGKYKASDATAFGFRCVGYPLIFFELPYNVVNPTSNTGGYPDLANRAGTAMTRLYPSPSDATLWFVNISSTVGDPYIRVFGKLHLNFPFGGGSKYGARAWDSQGALIFDTGCRQLRLTGNTYDAEMPINAEYPGVNSGATVGDTAISLPFNLSGKSIMANTRNVIRPIYATGSYFDPGVGQTFYTYDLPYIDSLFWASGNILWSRKSSSFTDNFTSDAGAGNSGTANIFYTRVAIIDNNLFP